MTEIRCDFDKATSAVTTIRVIAESIRTYGEGPDVRGTSRTAVLAREIHALAAEAESEIRGLKAWDVTSAKIIGDIWAVEPNVSDDKQIELTAITFDLLAVPSMSAYPRPGLATRVEKLRAAAAHLRAQASAWTDAVTTPATPQTCEELVRHASAVESLADSLTEDAIR